jgi:hypothetical protein
MVNRRLCVGVVQNIIWQPQQLLIIKVIILVGKAIISPPTVCAVGHVDGEKGKMKAPSAECQKFRFFGIFIPDPKVSRLPKDDSALKN